LGKTTIKEYQGCKTKKKERDTREEKTWEAGQENVSVTFEVWADSNFGSFDRRTHNLGMPSLGSVKNK
jgi:hypothetical protein